MHKIFFASDIFKPNGPQKPNRLERLEGESEQEYYDRIYDVNFPKEIQKRLEQKGLSKKLEEIATTEKENCTNPNNKNPIHLVTNVSVYYPKTTEEKLEFKKLGYGTSVFSEGKKVILETCLECGKPLSLTIRD